MTLKGTAIDQDLNILTDRYNKVDFTVEVYTLIASSVTDQIYSIG